MIENGAGALDAVSFSFRFLANISTITILLFFRICFVCSMFFFLSSRFLVRSFCYFGKMLRPKSHTQNFNQNHAPAISLYFFSFSIYLFNFFSHLFSLFILLSILLLFIFYFYFRLKSEKSPRIYFAFEFSLFFREWNFVGKNFTNFRSEQNIPSQFLSTKGKTLFDTCQCSTLYCGKYLNGQQTGKT